jgi:hypothetical protein
MRKKSEKTSPKVASIASKALKQPEAVTKKEIQALAGTALTQAVDKKPAPKAASKKAPVAPAAPAKKTTSPTPPAKPAAAKAPAKKAPVKTGKK